MEAADPGRVILLNGPSSSGKSSVAVALQALLPQPWFHFPIDALGAMRSVEATAALDDDGVASVLRRTRMGYHRAVAGLASARPWEFHKGDADRHPSVPHGHARQNTHPRRI